MDRGLVLGGSAAQTLLLNGKGGGEKHNEDRVGVFLLDLRGTVDVDLQYDVFSLGKHALHRLAGGAVIVAAVIVVLQHLAVFDLFLEFLACDVEVVDPVSLTGAGGSCGRRNRKAKIVGGQKVRVYRTLAASCGAGYYDQKSFFHTSVLLIPYPHRYHPHFRGSPAVPQAFRSEWPRE